jgi:acyl carrier protein
MKTTEEKVIEIIRSVKEIQYPITPEMSLTSDLYFDSLDMLMVINAIEADFSYKVDMGEVDKIKTVGDIIQALKDSTQKS